MNAGGHSRERVQLIHASDSLSTVPSGCAALSTPAFVPSKMSRQPIRVAKPPQPRPRQAHRETGNSYNDIVRFSEQQRKLIDANRLEIEAREARGNKIDNASSRLAALRSQVLREEREMARLHAVQREAREVRAERIAAERQLFGLQSSFSSQEQQLRDAVSKVEYLKAQLDLLHRRRLSAMNAALAQQKIINSQNQSLQSEETSRSSSLTEYSARPRASIEPFQISRSTAFSNREDTRQVIPSAAPPPPPPPPPPLPVQLHRTTTAGSSDFPDRVVFRVPYSNEKRLRREETPSPPKDPYPSPENAFEKSSTSKPLELNGFGGFPSQVNALDAKRFGQGTVSTVTGQSRRSANMHNLWNEARILDDEAPPPDLFTDSKSNRDEETKIARADQISIRADTLRAAKRRSWAQQENSVDETEYIRKILCEEQKKGRTHIILDPHIENLLSHSPHAQTKPAEAEASVQEKADMSSDESRELRATSTTSPREETQPAATSAASSVGEAEAEAEPEKVLPWEEEIQEESLDSVVLPVIDPDTLKLIKPAPEKGIIRAVGIKKERRNIVFDPLALLLDAALEGEMDLVQSSAAKMPNLSACNDEGITALHNAICAGHYEIVRFLVEMRADINAQDSDGWTPLHCAASCNNLPMVKLLVETGACIFAQTLSDLETPVEKCEEDEDGFDGCQMYLHAAHSCAGVVNQRQMYAAYSYEAEHEDELSFPAGACLKVIDREGDEKAWWLCEYITDGNKKEQGLAPRNYLSLYPLLAYRTSEFVHFEIPLDSAGPRQEANNNKPKEESLNEVNIEKQTSLVAS